MRHCKNALTTERASSPDGIIGVLSGQANPRPAKREAGFKTAALDPWPLSADSLPSLRLLLTTVQSAAVMATGRHSATLPEAISDINMFALRRQRHFSV